MGDGTDGPDRQAGPRGDVDEGVGALVDAVLHDDEPWVVCRAVRDQDGRVRDLEYVLANDAALAAVGLGPLVGRRMLELVPEIEHTKLPVFCEVLATGRPVRQVAPTVVREDHGWAPGWSEMTVRAHGDLLVVHWRDVTAEHTDALVAARDGALLRALLGNAVEVIAVLAPDARPIYVSPSLERVVGRREPAESLTAYVHPDDTAAVVEAFEQVVSGGAGAMVELELRMQHADGRWLRVQARGTNHLDEPDVAGVVVNLWDVTEQRLLADELRTQALHDPLTGLPNRRLVHAELERALGRTRRSPGLVGVVLCDVDHFKAVNDSLGHPAGDALLQQISDRLRGLVRPADTVGRFGGDEFVVICEDVGDTAQLAALTTRIRDMLRGDYALAGREVGVTVTLGAACARHPTEVDDLLGQADTALYAAKRDGRDRSQVFDEAVHRGHRDRLGLAQDLRRALRAEELRLHFQPLVDLRTGRTVAAEALVRWDHPRYGLLPPDQFLPVAEETSLGVDVGAWILHRAMVIAAAWEDVPSAAPLGWSALPGPPTVSVNISGRHLLHPDLLDHLDTALRESGLAPDRVELEITEAALLKDLEAARRVLQEVRSRGVRVALDDFGTGYSSLTWLQRLPVDTVKLDRSVVADLVAPDGQVAPEVLESITALAHALGKQVVVEGVETAEQGDHAVALGCDFAQGFLYGRPSPQNPFLSVSGQA